MVFYIRKTFLKMKLSKISWCDLVPSRKLPSMCDVVSALSVWISTGNVLVKSDNNATIKPLQSYIVSLSRFETSFWSQFSRIFSHSRLSVVSQFIPKALTDDFCNLKYQFLVLPQFTIILTLAFCWNSILNHFLL